MCVFSPCALTGPKTRRFNYPNSYWEHSIDHRCDCEHEWLLVSPCWACDGLGAVHAVLSLSTRYSLRLLEVTPRDTYQAKVNRRRSNVVFASSWCSTPPTPDHKVELCLSWNSLIFSFEFPLINPTAANSRASISPTSSYYTWRRVQITQLTES